MHLSQFIENSRCSARTRALYTCFGVAIVVGLAVINEITAKASAAELFSSRSLAPDATWLATRGAGAVSGTGLSSAMGNPAALTGLRRSGIAVSHLAWAGDLSRDWISVGSPLGSRLRFGLDASLLHGSALQGYDALGQETETFSASEWNLSPQLAFDLSPEFAIGAGLRYFRLEDPSDPVGGMGFSAGVRWARESRSLGASLTDWGSAQKTPAGSFDLPSRWRVGVEQSFGGFASAALSALGTADETRILAAASYHPVPWVSLLGGVESGEGLDGSSIGWSTGLSADRGGIVASYAFSDSPALGSIHQFGIEIPLRADRNLWDEPRRR